jgi:hypothetical protein
MHASFSVSEERDGIDLPLRSAPLDFDVISRGPLGGKLSRGSGLSIVSDEYIVGAMNGPPAARGLNDLGLASEMGVCVFVATE